MVFKKSDSMKIRLTILLSCILLISNAQSNTEKQVFGVYKQLLSVYGSAKTAPKLVFVKKGKLPVLPARYNSESSTIEVDIALYELCKGFGRDSLNAMSIVISHELTHYYNDHLFCSDYAWANLNSSNLNLAKKIQNVSLSSRKEKETEADIKGFFFALAAGFKPFGLQSKLIDKIYEKYRFSDIQKGYPTKDERKILSSSTEKEADKLFGYFNDGLLALRDEKYDVAINAFEMANSKIPYRENLNNSGVAKTLKALWLRPFSKAEIDMPRRFNYPVELDNSSRLKREVSRGYQDNYDKMESLLQSAKKDFETAINLDPNYNLSHINLACVYDMLGKHVSAIAEITEKLPKDGLNSYSAKQILAIAYYHAEMYEKAEKIWQTLNL